MSFDLKLENGDLKIDSTGDIAIVENSEKLIQDILKIILTDLGSNRAFPWYGCPINKALIGTPFTKDFVSEIASQQLSNSLNTLQRMQLEQIRKNQLVTAQEQIASVERASIERNPVDPRFFSIYVTVLSKSFKRVNVPTIDISL